jgi:hypothetical protein
LASRSSLDGDNHDTKKQEHEFLPSGITWASQFSVAGVTPLVATPLAPSDAGRSDESPDGVTSLNESCNRYNNTYKSL